MASVTLTAPIKHGEEWLPAGTVLDDLTDKAAARLVSLEVAVSTTTLEPAEDDADSEDMGEQSPEEAETEPAEDDESEADMGELSPEEAAEIRQMKKPALIEALTNAGAPLDGNENVPQLRSMLMKAWSQPGVDGVNG